MTVDVVLDAYYRVTGTIPRGSDHQRSGRCPAHDDGRASFSIRLDHDRVLLKCHAGCTFEDIVSALGITAADTYNQPLEKESRGRGDDTWIPCGRHGHNRVAQYVYEDEQRQVVHGVTRCDHKCFAQWRPDSTARSGKRWSLNDDRGQRLVRLVPFMLPELLAGINSDRVAWIAEGEKDCLALQSHGLVATCNAGGAGKWTAEHAQFLRGADVNIVADRDEPGKRHAVEVVETLRGLARSCTVYQAAFGKDAADHFAGGGHTGNFLQVWEPIPFPVGGAQ